MKSTHKLYNLSRIYVYIYIYKYIYFWLNLKVVGDVFAI